MKIIDVSKMDRKQREDAINEVHVLKAMRHPYIITYKESFMDKRCLCIVMDYADGGDLYTKIANQKKIGKGESQTLSYSLLLRRPDSRLVRANGTGHQAHP
jgi:NIMA (never in mitosis gene a)-related kinase